MSGMEAGQMLAMQLREKGKSWDYVAAYVKAVSYTHLDVYKRQAAGTGPPGSAVCRERVHACGLAAFFARPEGACFSH